MEDRPLHQIRNESRVKLAWDKLQNLYSPEGFASEFLLCKQFFDNTLAKHNSMEEYVNKVKILRDDLENKGLKLPAQLICAWVLNGLTSNYNGFVGMKTQGYRENKEVNLDNLFNHLLDKAHRVEAMEPTETALFSREKKYKNKPKHKGQKPTGVQKNRKHPPCKSCKKTNHTIENCWFEHPNLRPTKNASAKTYAVDSQAQTEGAFLMDATDSLPTVDIGGIDFSLPDLL